MRKIVTGRRLAIRVDDDTLLAVPPLPAGLPSEVRVKVFEAVLTRQFGLAQTIVDIAADGLTAGTVRDRLEAMIGQAPFTGAAA